MAYIAKVLESDEEWHGPIPNKKGEFCGNHHPDSSRYQPPDWLDWGRVPKPDAADKGRYFGRPSACVAGTSDEMAARGYVGLYLSEDSPIIGHPAGTVEIDTDALLEEVVSGQRLPERPFNPQILIDGK